jgi:hypothetical protein
MNRVVVTLLLAAGCGRVQGEQCAAAADCADPAAPFCVDSFCVAACATNADCGDPERPLCADDGACVGCLDDSDCDTAAPVCDEVAHACRSCAEDAECPGGVCVDVEGTCVGDAAVGFVAIDGTDPGECTRAAPCATVGFALGPLGTSRRVIHILGPVFPVDATILLDGDHVLDGEATQLRSSVDPTIRVTSRSGAIVEGVRLEVVDRVDVPAIAVATNSAAQLHEVAIAGTGTTLLLVDRGSDVTATESHFGSFTTSTFDPTQRLHCFGGTLRVERSVFERAFASTQLPVGSDVCELTITRSRIESDRDGSVAIGGGRLIMENNLIIHHGAVDSIGAEGLRNGSAVRFNTIVNTTAEVHDRGALFCDAAVDVTGNIFHYNSTSSVRGTCATRFSIFDDVSTTSAGTGNLIAEPDAVFVDRAAGDYHLAPNSVGRDAADPDVVDVTVDFEGRPRPSSTGTRADIGAFEAP